MSTVGSERAVLRHPRLASLATADRPAWLWSADGSRILWANAVGAAIFGAKTSSACAKRRFSVTEVPAAQVLRLGATLPSGEQERLERLRGFGGNLGRALTCTCSRLMADHGSGAVLIVAAESAGPELTLADRVARLLDDDDEPAAVFMPDGRLVHANAKADHWLGGEATLAALGLDVVAAAALQTGSARTAAERDGAACEVLLARLGEGVGRVVLVVFRDVARPTNHAFATGIEPETEPQNRRTAPILATAPGKATAGPDRRHPLRFVWEMDADGRFSIVSEEFTALIGAHAALLGRRWADIAAELNLDPQDQVANAVASRETWSGIYVSWPIAAPPASDRHGQLHQGQLRLPIALSGLPVFDRDRKFRGYRGFGVCRDLTRIDGLAPPAPAEAVPRSAPPPKDSTTVVASDRAAAPVAGDPASPNVVPFRPAAVEPKSVPSLTPIERRAFRELAQELNSRLRGAPAAATAEARAQELMAQELTASQKQALSRDELRQVLNQALNQENGQDFDEQSGEHKQAVDGQASEQPVETANQEPSNDDKTQNEDRSAGPSEPASEATGKPSPDTPNRLVEQLIEPAFLDRIQLGILVYRHDAPLFANRQFLHLSGYSDIAAIEAAGGLNRLFAEPVPSAAADSAAAQALAIITHAGERLPVEGRMVAVPWHASSAMALIIDKSQSGAAPIEAASSAAAEEAAGTEPETERVAAAKAEFVAKISRDIRDPLNAITGFAEAIMSERFGPIGNERYRQYIKDLHAAVAHLSSMVDDRFDLSKLDGGDIDLTFTKVNLNEVVQQCVGMMQPQANRARIIIRSALTSGLPLVKADERALREIMVNLLSNSIRFTGPGGQIIVSTVFSDTREAILRIRDTGVGMSEKQMAAALEPGEGDASANAQTGLPPTKALAEANHAQFRIKSAPEAGTLVEIAFPPNRTLAA
jgi:signal transduction histidine kinase/PAS domain-containing protein